MNTKNNTRFPQTVEIPSPLEVHPCIPANLANEMIEAADFISKHPELYNGREPVFVRSGCGCVLAIIEKNMKVREVREIFPKHETALTKIFKEADTATTAKNPAWAIQRIEHFLRTGE